MILSKNIEKRVVSYLDFEISMFGLSVITREALGLRLVSRSFCTTLDENSLLVYRKSIFDRMAKRHLLNKIDKVETTNFSQMDDSYEKAFNTMTMVILRIKTGTIGDLSLDFVKEDLKKIINFFSHNKNFCINFFKDLLKHKDDNFKKSIVDLAQLYANSNFYLNILEELLSEPNVLR